MNPDMGTMNTDMETMNTDMSVTMGDSRLYEKYFYGLVWA